MIKYPPLGKGLNYQAPIINGVKCEWLGPDGWGTSSRYMLLRRERDKNKIDLAVITADSRPDRERGRNYTAHLPWRKANPFEYSASLFDLILRVERVVDEEYNP